MGRILGAAMIVSCCAVQAAAQSAYLLSGGYSVLSDNVPDRGTLVITDQKVSPFFSHASGTGFDISVTRIGSKHLAFAGDFSGYFDRFSGGATYCQSTGCAPGLTHEAKTKAYYLVAGPEYRGGEWRRLTFFAHGLLRAVMTSSEFIQSVLERPDLQNANMLEATGTTHQQDHTRLTFGIVWKLP